MKILFIGKDANASTQILRYWDYENMRMYSLDTGMAMPTTKLSQVMWYGPIATALQLIFGKAMFGSENWITANLILVGISAIVVMALTCLNKRKQRRRALKSVPQNCTLADINVILDKTIWNVIIVIVFDAIMWIAAAVFLQRAIADNSWLRLISFDVSALIAAWVTCAIDPIELAKAAYILKRKQKDDNLSV